MFIRPLYFHCHHLKQIRTALELQENNIDVEAAQYSKGTLGVIATRVKF
jgi:hypothetical protein